ncbi:MAG: SDR family NAD(P)-dependent oxidoreductase [Myxococcales bacterium]|nr:SDR family NAD(P)-dependent oxidoreductase [Myxococcales bacterium]
MAAAPHALILGVGPGLGRALARRFGQGGFRLTLGARRKTVLDEFVRELSAEGIEARAEPVDVADEVALRASIARSREIWGDHELLIYNTSLLHEGLPSEIAIESFVRDFRINVAGALVAAQEVGRPMRRNGHGTIFMTGGGLALDPWPEMASLAVGKAGLRNLALSVAKEFEPDGVRVSTVTIGGMIQENSPFSPQLIADRFWELYGAEGSAFAREVIFSG